MSKHPRRQHPDIDHARRLPRWDPERCEAENDLFQEALQETLDEPEPTTDGKTSPGELRGIPVVGSGAGAMADTNPEDCIDRIDNQRGAA